MIRIVSDTSTLYSTTQAIEAGFEVSPLCVSIAGKTYREFDEISSKEFVDIIKQGHLPSSSQPSIGEVFELYEKYAGDEIVNIVMADGLSGTYNSALAAKEMSANKDNITVINSRTLCGPHRYLVENAVSMAKAGHTKDEIVARTNELMDSGKSFLIPADFEYLRRGGRLSPAASYLGQVVHFAPVMTQSENGGKLVLSRICRGFKSAFRHIEKMLSEWGVGDDWRIYISHADTIDMAELARQIMSSAFPSAYIEILPLSPAFITQGGPGCVAVQVIHN